MSNAEVGAQAERMALAYLRGHFPGLERTRATSLTKAERYQKHPDTGDITGLRDWAIEVKSMGQIKLAQAVDQAAAARLVKGGRVRKRVGRHAGVCVGRCAGGVCVCVCVCSFFSAPPTLF